MGPLEGVRVLEIAGMGPAPFCGMVLADLGAEVIRVERPGGHEFDDAVLRSRRCISVDMKHVDGISTVLRLVEHSDALIEGFRPGVMERLGLGPQPCLERNAKLVYGRMTGWGQDGPLAHAPGHDINYIALAGVLAHLGRVDAPPTPPLNLLGDYGGGGMLLAVGVLGGLLHAARTGVGQVIDAAMVDGSALLMTFLWSMRSLGSFHDGRGTNILDSGAPYYDAYVCADGGYVAVGAVEPQFYARLLELAGLAEDPLMAGQHDVARWPAQKARLAQVFLTRSVAAWCELLEGTDACFAPVLEMTAAVNHPHNVARGTFTTVGGMVQPAPAPRFGGSPLAQPTPTRRGPEESASVLRDAGLTDAEVRDLLQRGVVR